MKIFDCTTYYSEDLMLDVRLNILDPYVLNIGIEFVIKPHASVNKFVALDNAIKALRSKYNTTYYIGEQFSISDIYSYLKEVPGVLDVLKVVLVVKYKSTFSVKLDFVHCIVMF